MTDNNHRDILRNSVRRRRRQRQVAAGDKDGSLGRDFAWMGGIAWLIVAPLLLGAFLGRVLDRMFDSGVAMTAALIFVGACLGGYLAWQRIQQP
jgi:ATP synthase protein I